MPKHELAPAQEALPGVLISDGLAFRFELQHNQLPLVEHSIPEAKSREQPGHHHLAALDDGQQGINHSKIRHGPDMGPVSRHPLDRPFIVMNVYGPYEVIQKHMGVLWVGSFVV